MFQALEHLPQPAFLVDKQFVCCYANVQARLLLHAQVGKQAREILPGWEPIGSQRWQQGGQTWLISTWRCEEKTGILLRDVQALHTAEQRLASTQRLSALGCWEADLKTGLVFWSEEMYRLMGLPDTFVPTVDEFMARVPDDDKQKIWDALARARDRGGVYDVHHRIVRADGTVRHVHEQAECEFDAEGQLLRAQGTMMDTTDRLLAEEQLRRSEARFRGLMEQSPLSVQVLNADGYTVAVNEAWEQLWGIKLEQIPDYNMLEDVQLESLGILPIIRRAFAGEAVHVPAAPYDPNKTIPNRSRHSDPVRWVRAFLYPIKDDSGRVVEVVLTHEDVSAQHRAEMELRSVAGRLALALEASGAGDWTWSAATDTVWLSEVAADIFGIPPGPHMTWLQLRDLLHSDDQERARSRVEQSIADRTLYDIDYRVRTPDGGWRWVSSKGKADYAEDGAVLGMTGLVQDVTERKRLEEALRQKVDELAQADQRKNEFLAMLGHELRNPLAPIQNALEILELQRDDETGTWCRGIIRRQVSHLTRLVDDLLEVSRITRGKIELRCEPLDLITAVGGAVEAARPLMQERSLQVALPSGPVMVQADPTRISQILGNLLNNAARYTNPGGHVQVRLTKDNGQAVVQVSDDGVGLDAGSIQDIFKMFVQAAPTLDRSRGGLGIGLTLVQRLVELHGGTVTAASPGPGQGSVFEVRLPLLLDAAVPLRATGAILSDKQLTVLVVDDNQDSASSLATLLKLRGHQVELAHDGVSGLESALRLNPAVVLLDIGLPGLSGYEVAERLRQQQYGGVLIAITGYGQIEDRAQALSAGFDEHLRKPVDLEGLAVAISNCLVTKSVNKA